MSQSKTIETPVIGYVAITIALLAGMITASAFGDVGNGGIQNLSDATAKPISARLKPRDPKPVPNPMPKRRWVLGVRADASVAGYVVRSVQHGTTADREGLEPGDRIVAVSGQQVGYVGTECISLARTLDTKGGQNGRVRLLVQNHRNHRLVAISVNLSEPLRRLGH